MKKLILMCIAALAMVACSKDGSAGAELKPGMNIVEGSGVFYNTSISPTGVVAKFTVNKIKVSDDKKSVLEIYGVGYEMDMAAGPDEKTADGLRFSFDLQENSGKSYFMHEDILLFRKMPTLTVVGNKVSMTWDIMLVTGAPRQITFECTVKN